MSKKVKLSIEIAKHGKLEATDYTSTCYLSQQMNQIYEEKDWNFYLKTYYTLYQKLLKELKELSIK
jgi:hypothetical protein